MIKMKMTKPEITKFKAKARADPSTWNLRTPEEDLAVAHAEKNLNGAYPYDHSTVILASSPLRISGVVKKTNRSL